MIPLIFLAISRNKQANHRWRYLERYYERVNIICISHKLVYLCHVTKLLYIPIHNTIHNWNNSFLVFNYSHMGLFPDT